MEPALSRAAPVAGLGDLALAPLPAHCQAVESVIAGTRLGRCPPACGRGLLIAIGRIAFALAHCLGETSLARIALGMTGRDLLLATGLNRSVCNPLLFREVTLTARGHAIPLAARGHGCGCLFPLTVRGHRIKAGEPDVSNGRVWTVTVFQAPVVSEASAMVAAPVAGGAVTALPFAVQDLARFFLSLTGSSSQGAVGSVVGATVPASGASALGRRAAASCAATARPPSDSAAVSSSSDRQQREEELVVARPAVGPAERVRNALGNAPLHLVALLVAGRSPIALLRAESPPPSAGRVPGVHLAIHSPLRQVTARLVLALRAGGRGHPLQRSGITQALAVICPPLLRARWTMTVLVPSIPWTLTGMTLPVCPGPHSELPQHGRAGECTISSM